MAAGSHRANGCLLDVATGDCQVVFRDPWVGGGPFVPASWSPDSRWLVYIRNNPTRFGSVFLYSLDEKREYRVTDEMVPASSPCFDPQGRYLYWLAECRMNVEDSLWDNDHHLSRIGTILAAALRPGIRAPWCAPGGEGQPPTPPAVGTGPGLIEPEGLSRRIFPLPVADGQYSSLLAVKGGIVYQVSAPDGSENWKRMDLAQRREESITSDGFFCSCADACQRLVWRTNQGMVWKDLAGEREGHPVVLDQKGVVDLRLEWEQIFADAWRIQRDLFFDDSLHGVDWEAMKKKYHDLLPHVATRSDLNALIESLYAELGQSHTEIYGGELPTLPQRHDGLLGVDLQRDAATHRYRISRILNGRHEDPQTCSPLAMPGTEAREGDFLLAIDGHELRDGINPDRFLVNKAGEPVVLTLADKPESRPVRRVTVLPQAYSEQQGDLLRYTDWVLANRQKVHRLSGGRIGYIQIPDTYLSGIAAFFRDFYPQSRKEALVIDIRYNSGGYPPDWMVERLCRRYPLKEQMPDRKAPFESPDPGFFGQKVCLTNAWAESGGDLFAATFRLLKAGSLVGERTCGNLASTGAIRLVDGGVVIYPMVGPVNEQGVRIIESKGILPDRVVENHPDRVMAGEDPQLEASVGELMQEMGKGGSARD